MKLADLRKRYAVSPKAAAAALDRRRKRERDKFIHFWVGACEGPCQRRSAPVKLWDSQTCYVWDGPDSGKPNPNAPLTLCEGCGQEYSENMKAQWDDYYSDRL